MSGYSSESDVWDRPAYDIVGTEVTVIANPLKVTWQGCILAQSALGTKMLLSLTKVKYAVQIVGWHG